MNQYTSAIEELYMNADMLESTGDCQKRALELQAAQRGHIRDLTVKYSLNSREHKRLVALCERANEKRQGLFLGTWLGTHTSTMSQDVTDIHGERGDIASGEEAVSFL